jgi:AraC-like DNA-binding protein
MMDKKEVCFIPQIEYIVYRKCTPSWKMNEQFLSECGISYVISGKARFTINGKYYDVIPGDLLCLPHSCIRKATTFPDQLMHSYAVNFLLKDISGKSMELPFPILNHIGINKNLINIFNELVFTWLDRQPGYIIKTSALFLSIVHILYELIVYNINTTTRDYRIMKTERFIAKHYTDKLTVKSLAEMVGLNASYFGTLFNRETNFSVNRYITKTRLRNAENMLRSGDFKVKEVAEHCGYSDVYHFYKQFRAFLGFPPSQCIPKRQN